MTPETETHRATAATNAPQYSDANAKRRVSPATVLLMTTLAAADGTILLMAAKGTLNSWTGAATVGLTMISGAGAWVAARQAFAERTGFRDWLVLAALAMTTIVATVAAAAAGVWLGSAVELIVLPRAVGIVLLLVAAEVGGLRLPRPGNVPLPVVGTGAAGGLEVMAHWML